MTTTTTTTLETDKVVGGPVAGPAVEQQGRAMDEAAAAGAWPGATRAAPRVTRRGRQRTPKPWPMAVLCRLGMHQGRWAFVAEGRCTQGRECARCGSVHMRTKHQREWRYVRDQSCGQVRSCTRCNAANGERTSHEWGETWEPETRWWQNEKGAHRCLRCGVEEEWTVSDPD